jgi:hypothetical protein
MASESPEQSEWRKEFEAMSPVQKRMLLEPDKSRTSSDPKLMYMRALLLEDDSNKLDVREDEALAIARAANTIALAATSSASDANDIARSAKKYAFIAAMAAIVAAAAAIKWR